MIGDKHILSATSRAIGISMLSGEVIVLVHEMRWMILLSFVLIAADFWFGVSESKMLGREIRRSKAWRRSWNKCVDYICYMMIAGVLGMAIGEPLGVNHIRVTAVVMLLTCVWELDSIYGHICVLNGAKKDFSIRKFLFGLFKRKAKDAINDGFINESNDKKEEQQ